ncbi:Sec1-like protein [Basidiobolus meristosporus CBS 931.73]|uniref:Sec1-like protein n=1 Tax=Basidiobolus meristosporus CBS 931.73 TaxID=1314790 RepID=A0A1Y1XU17_9FUNG|nr:Sec1-like protein [Basidiobolus meristosporus CBS 931.73]|eukprot:ORX89238.1 Sec1-like protein [Basidiobolus meristosporus CBS 931.73]
MKYIKSIKEVYVDLFSMLFLRTPETRLFDLKLHQSIVRLFSSELKDNLPKELEVIAKKIASACYTLKENPIIRYFKPDGEINSCTVAEQLAKAVEKELEHLSVKEKSYLQNTTEPRASLIILDRTLDMKAPLLHDITYQAMAYDMLDITDDRKYQYEITDNTNNVVEKKASLDENDQLWVKYRHTYFADTIKELVSELNKLTSKKLQNKPGMSPQAMIQQLREAVFQLPDYQEFKEKLSCHFTMVTECKELFQTYNYAELVPLEQILATGEDAEGNTVKHMLDEVIHLVRELDNDDNRLRLLLLYLTSKDGIREENLQTIRDQTGILANSEDDLTLNNITHMGVKVLKDSKKGTNLYKKLKSYGVKSKDETIRYDLMLKRVIENEIKQTLPEANFPFVKEQNQEKELEDNVFPRALRYLDPQWIKRRDPAVNGGYRGSLKGRVIVFMAGGLTYSELRTIYELTEDYDRDIVVGTTNMITPHNFLKDLTELHRPAPTRTRTAGIDQLPDVAKLQINTAGLKRSSLAPPSRMSRRSPRPLSHSPLSSAASASPSPRSEASSRASYHSPSPAATPPLPPRESEKKTRHHHLHLFH